MHDTISKSSHDDAVKGKEEVNTKSERHKRDILWISVIYLATLHVIGLYGLITFNYFQNLKTTLWLLFMYELGSIGMTAGVHRLWSHRSYSANLPLRLILFIGYCSCGGVIIKRACLLCKLKCSSLPKSIINNKSKNYILTRI
ncbi:PREDICTED: acyl-CoA desaturase-like [Wasmannia auropunctata]|uniref:acyl-CoA desaturase-like n=1 Tax=Wasmannia auropunctata TaxID=64793 RepID=UPI0005F027C7|nr:PREDICTED: acyl-CoA desaturase-like [Wasmannia auropunctata]XP_011698203.1 PREDICTED: acyl-CoA desaturase-like [Wasmannia auropunctata]XP_011698204.1 PREDICTED: acyl-CoA desaturase-like [Wasmannia auropunctata]XP_011698205.1 PREDICTED: acyl-CoA desaturase-like [Wasmannia auropunctata]XP_011698206.1 PREDICTED: acyl-CoA desaturase-like [Wasmannia auropunctata]